MLPTSTNFANTSTVYCKDCERTKTGYEDSFCQGKFSGKASLQARSSQGKSSVPFPEQGIPKANLHLESDLGITAYPAQNLHVYHFSKQSRIRIERSSRPALNWEWDGAGTCRLADSKPSGKKYLENFVLPGIPYQIV